MSNLMEQVAATRRRLGISQEKVAEELSELAGYRIRVTAISCWERRVHAPSQASAKLLREWLRRNGGAEFSEKGA